MLDVNSMNGVKWLPSNNKQFSTKSVKEVIRVHGERVSWWKLIWFKGYVPRMAVILSMTFKRKLLTRSKLQAWGCIQDDTCVQCWH